MKRFLSTVAALAFATVLCGGFADAKTCRDAHGKFTKCKPAPTHCRDSKGRFKKC